MNCIIETTLGASPQLRDTSSRTDHPRAGFTLAKTGALKVPSLSKFWAAHFFARLWHDLHPGIPLIPVRRRASDPEEVGNSSQSARWVPVEGWWDGTHSGQEVHQFLKADRSLGVGLRLGRLGAGIPRLVDILARNAGEAEPALRRMLDVKNFDWAATWDDEEGTHRIFIADDRLARVGPVVVGANNGEGGNPRYSGLEIRLGSDDPATSLVVLPPTPLRDGTPRRWRAFLGFRLLPASVYADLEQFSPTANTGADEPQATSTVPDSDVPGEAPGPRPKRRRKVVALRGPEDLAPGGATFIESPDREVSATTSLLDFKALATSINRSHRRCKRAADDAFSHARRTGDELLQVKAGLEYGKFQEWVGNHCTFKYRMAAAYMKISLRWQEIEQLRASVRLLPF
jgi:hypothetical protein